MAFMRTVNGAVGNSKEPYVTYVRASTGSFQAFIPNDIIKKYKKIRMMSAQDYVDYAGSGASTVSTYITITSANFAMNDVSGSYQITLTNTPVDVSTLNLTDGAISYIEATTGGSWAGMVFEAYDG